MIKEDFLMHIEDQFKVFCNEYGNMDSELEYASSVYSQLVELIEKYISAIKSSDYNFRFYEEANIGMQGLCGKILNDAMEKMEAKEIVEIPDDVDADTAHALLKENFVKLKTNCNLGTMNVAVHKIFFDQEALQEKIKKLEKLKEEKTPEELEAIFQNASIEEDDDFYFEYGCSKNDARALETLIGEQVQFDGLLRAE